MKKFLLLPFLLSLIICMPKAYSIEDIVSLDEIEAETTAAKSTAKVLQAEVKFDWLDISQAQRDENIEHFKTLLFDNNTSEIRFTKDGFKKKFAAYKKDKDFKLHYMLANNGVTEDEDAKYCAFYYKKNTLVMYAVQYKNQPQYAFYYSAFGRLYYTDIMSDEYPDFPYTSMQYNKTGQLKSAIYFVSKDMQYMYDPEGGFQGLWYKDKMYDKNGKQTLSRTSW